MSDYKQAYSDISKDYIENVVPYSDLDKARYDRSKARESKYNDAWLKQKVNLNEIVDQFVPEVEKFSEKHKKGGVKYEFEGDQYVIKCDKVAGYLRIYDKIAKSYCKLDGSPSDSLEDTHFKIKRREEM
ncbi:MAG: hypothetical protein Q4B60_09025 [Erysipelotrichaceae bacterium]|nr:hypothetical protein [Erysipelotrichaceae bacterium]